MNRALYTSVFVVLVLFTGTKAVPQPRFVGIWQNKRKISDANPLSKKLPKGVAVARFVIRPGGKWERKVTLANGTNFTQQGIYTIKGTHLITSSQKGSYVRLAQSFTDTHGLKPDYRHWCRVWVTHRLLNPKQMSSQHQVSVLRRENRENGCCLS
jgi:hypothetical protein